MTLAPSYMLTTPQTWPEAPSPWNFSVLKEIEACPRRWALSAAAYPDVWGGTGYPRALNTNALKGQIIHAVVTTVSSALATAGCVSARDGAAVEVLRGLGGMTGVLQEAIDRALERHRKNPRAVRAMDRVRNDLLKDIPAMRQQVQHQLQRLTLTPRPCPTSPSTSASWGRLRDGSYHELRLHAQELDFVGVIDLLQLEDGQCTIWEFKTGAPDDRHVEQLSIYALLWTEDKQRNPPSTPATRLFLSYEHRLQELDPISPSALAALHTALLQRIRAATGMAREQPPSARPVSERCRYCDVRHLCEEYWVALSTWQGDDPDRLWGDMEIRVGAKRGPRSWDAVVVGGANVAHGTPVVLAHENRLTEHCLTEGTHVRLLSVRQSVVDGVTLVAITAMTEIFRVG